MSRVRKLNPGVKVGRWTVIEYPYKSKKVLVRCDCGFEAWRHHANLHAGTSLGCKNCSRADPAKQTFTLTKNTAVKRGRLWDLTFENWKKLASENCHYCGIEPSNLISAYGYKYNGIDRVDSSLAYTLDNCVSCCKICNRAKSNMKLEDFYEWVRRVYVRSTPLQQ